MCEQGYTATRVEQICNAAGVTKGAFFHYFKTKDDLGRQTVKHWQAKVRQEFLDDGAWREEEDPVRRVFGHLSHVRDRLAERDSQQGCVYCVCAMEAARRDPEMAGLVRTGLDEWRDELAAMIERAADGKALRPTARELADNFMAAMEGSHIMAKARDDSDERRATMEHFRRYLAYAMGYDDPPV